MKRLPPPCPACGSSATLPFENSDPTGSGESVTEVVLGTLFFFLSLLAILLFFLLSRASLPAALLLLMTLFLYWRRRRERDLWARSRPRPYVCLDCSSTFTA